MRLQTRLVTFYILAVLVAVTALFGCRAFVPETVIVNHPPETYLTGAPVDEGSGQFHFHLFWHGTDSDGRVERYVWALTDSTIQDEDTDDDEEDIRFNPALIITTLEIGHWTTRTDTIIDFQINQGSVTSRDMTFHIVAVDDRGDFDRTPARLYFLSNALGTPEIAFYDSHEQNSETLVAEQDTIGYAKPFVISWNGTTPNIRSFSDQLLAERDTVPPLDGLYGYKYRLPLDVDCDEVNEDCWFPQRFDIAENRMPSYFGDVIALDFANDNTGSDVSLRRLTQGVHLLLVNTTDVAGVEVPLEKQEFPFVVNYDPDTAILGLDKDFDGDGVFETVPSEDPFYTDPNVYPYFTVYRPDGTTSTASFAVGDTLPDRSVAVFKALGWDDGADTRFSELDGVSDPGYGVAFQAKFEAVGKYLGGENSAFRFETEFSNVVASVWDDPFAVGSADTMSTIVGPFEYEFFMRAVDEHGRRDGTPEIFEFAGNRPPVVEALEVSTAGATSGFPDGSSAADIDTFYVALVPGASDYVSANHSSWTQLEANPDEHEGWVNPNSGSVVIDSDPVGGGYSAVGIPMRSFDYEVKVYAQDSPDERLFLPRTAPGGETFGEPRDRMMSCRYEIVSHRDSLTNIISDGSGVDDLLLISYTMNPDNHADSYDDNGVWSIPVRVYAPNVYFQVGELIFKSILGASNPTWSPEQIDRAFQLLTMQFGLSTATVIARDGTVPAYNDDHCAYVYYQSPRAPEVHGESCEDPYTGAVDRLQYQFFSFESAPMQKQYVLKMVANPVGPNPPEIFPPLP